MEIKWHGNTCFTLKDKGVRLIVNPDKEAGKLKGDIALSSLKQDASEVSDTEKVIDWPGEYEIKGIHIAGFEAWTKSRSKEKEEGSTGDETIIFYFDIGKIKCCHLGGLGHVLMSETVKAIGDVDVLMIDIGEKSNLNTKKSMEIIEAIDPRMLIPMGTGKLKEALKDLGADKISTQEEFTVKSANELPEDKRLYVILKKS